MVAVTNAKLFGFSSVTYPMVRSEDMANGKTPLCHSFKLLQLTTNMSPNSHIFRTIEDRASELRQNKLQQGCRLQFGFETDHREGTQHSKIYMCCDRETRSGSKLVQR